MKNLNEFKIQGRLQRSVKVETTKNGFKYGKLSIEVIFDALFKGQKQERKTWFNLTVWNELAEDVASKLQENDQILVEGYMQVKALPDSKMTTTELMVTSVKKAKQKKQKESEEAETAPDEPSESSDFDFDDHMNKNENND